MRVQGGGDVGEHEARRACRPVGGAAQAAARAHGHAAAIALHQDKQGALPQGFTYTGLGPEVMASPLPLRCTMTHC